MQSALWANRIAKYKNPNNLQPRGRAQRITHATLKTLHAPTGLEVYPTISPAPKHNHPNRAQLSPTKRNPPSRTVILSAAKDLSSFSHHRAPASTTRNTRCAFPRAINKVLRVLANENGDHRPMAPVRILIADDSPTVRAGLKLLLQYHADWIV